MFQLTKFLPSAAFFLAGIGFELSDIQSPKFAIFLWVLAIGLLSIPAWPYLIRLRLRSPIYLKASKVSGKEDAGHVSVSTITISDGNSSSPIVIDFDSDKYFLETEVPPKIGMEPLKKRTFWFYVEAKQDIENVGVEVDKREELPNSPDDLVYNPKKSHAQLRFDGHIAPKIDFSSAQREKVFFVERIRGFPNPDSEPVVFCNTSESFHHRKRENLIYLKVTGKGIKPYYKVLSVWVGDGHHLRVAFPQVKPIGS